MRKPILSPSSPARPRLLASTAELAAALLFVGALGCASSGSSFDTTGKGGSGSTGVGSGGTGGSSSGVGGSSDPGTAGTGQVSGDAGSSGGDPISGAAGSSGEAGTSGSAGGGSGSAGSSPGTGGGAAGRGGSSGTAGRGGTTGTAGSVAGTSGGGSTGRGGTTGAAGAAGTTGTGGAVATCPKGAGQICHEFLANDNSRNQINYVNEFDPSKNWTKPVGDTGANSPRTIEIVDNSKAKTGKGVLVSLEKGYGEFDLQDGTLLGRVSNKSGVSGACRLPDGNTALGTNAVIIVVNATGTEVRRITLPAGDELRAINRNPTDGHFWFSKVEEVYDMSDTGAVNWMGNMGAGTKGYAVWWRAGGGAYATTGDPSTVIEMDSTGKILNTVGGKAMFTSVGLDFFSGFVRLANGNFVVANWLGHLSAPGANTPHVVEFTPQNKVVWQWGNQTLARQITNVYVFR